MSSRKGISLHQHPTPLQAQDDGARMREPGDALHNAALWHAVAAVPMNSEKLLSPVHPMGLDEGLMELRSRLRSGGCSKEKQRATRRMGTGERERL